MTRLETIGPTLGILTVLGALVAPGALAQSTAEEAEAAVRDRIGRGRMVVVHFWAPWCQNSASEFRSGWYEILEDSANADVEFLFVTVWNDGKSGRDMLDRYAIPPSVPEIRVPDDGPSEILHNRRRFFLDLPLTWIPSTWIFHPDGQLAYAFNYGEIRMETLRQAISDTRETWHYE